MKKFIQKSGLALLALIFVLGLSNKSNAQDSTKVFFSEYIEGSGNNKALEIYNGTGVEIDLSKLMIIKASNGGTFEAASDAQKFQFIGTLASEAVYVIANGE